MSSVLDNTAKLTLENRTKNSFLDYLLVSFLIGVSNVPILFGDIHYAYIFPIALLVFIIKRKNMRVEFVLFLALYVLLMIFQGVFLGTFKIVGFFALTMRIIFAYLVVDILSEKFMEIYLNVILFFAYISLVFWSLFNLIPSTLDFAHQIISPVFDSITIVKVLPHIGLYTLNVESQFEGYLFRNSGPFWEPGGFGVFLNLAILFNFIRSKKMFNKRFFVLTATLLTTQSTGQYIAYFSILIFYLFFIQKGLGKVAMITILATVAVFLFNNFSFLGEKISDQIEYADAKYSHQKLANTRIVGAKKDLEDFVKSPIIGRSRFVGENLEVNNSFYEYYRNNGTTNFIATNGLVGVLLYFVFAGWSLVQILKREKLPIFYSIVFIVGLLAIGFSQNIFFKPFLLAMPLLFATISKQVEMV